MTPVRLRPKRKIAVSGLVYMAIFALVSAVASVATGLYGGLALTVIFGLFGGFFAWMLIPGTVYLELSTAGLEERFLTLRRRWKWSDFESFCVVETPEHTDRGEMRTFVCFRHSPTYAGPRKPCRIAAPGGCDGYLIDLFGLEAEELVALLNEWRNKSDAAH